MDLLDSIYGVLHHVQSVASGVFDHTLNTQLYTAAIPLSADMELLVLCFTMIIWNLMTQN